MPRKSTAPRNTTLRQIAAEAGVSLMTVSRALHDSPLVREVVREKVKRVAGRLGYVVNPLTGALMAEIRRSRAGAFRGVLAVLDIDGPVGRLPGAEAYHGELSRGATGRANELGFSADCITVGKSNLSVARLDGILHARGIRGLFVLPVLEQPDLTRLEWAHFSGIYADFLIEQPGLHTVCPDHYRAMRTVLERLRALGYRRAGLVLNTYHNDRLLQRWEAAYHAHHTKHPEMTYLPPLIRARQDKAGFVEWFRAVRCDVVLSHSVEVMTWMRAAGARVPETHGFCCLNVLNSRTPCAGVDLQPRLIGARGMEMLIGMVLRNECGAPEQPMTTALPAKWVDGPTVRDTR